MYTFRARVRYSETDANGYMPLGSIINYMQDCSTFQSEDLGVGIKYLKEKQRVWLLSSWQIVIEQAPKFAQNIVVGTQAYDFRGIFGYRNFVIMDEAGRYLVKANSIWCLVDVRTGKPARVRPEFVECYGQAKPLEMDYAKRKILVPDAGSRQEEFLVKPHHIDTNCHVNNGQYVQMALEYLPQEFEIYQMRADYRIQARLGDTIVPVVRPIGKGYVVSLENPEQKPYCVVEFSSREGCKTEKTVC